MSQLNLLKKAVADAGGTKTVAVACGLSYEAVRKWLANGLPRTEFSGETEYAETICRLAATHGHSYSASDLLRDTTRRRKRRAA